jgi:lysophospholipase L1-like esterase
LSSIKSNIALFNSKISSVAAAKGLALVDVNHFYKTLQTGVKFNGVTMSASFISGAAFSLDGIHPSNKGFALIANEFITVINARFKSNLPPVDANSYTGILFP